MYCINVTTEYSGCGVQCVVWQPGVCFHAVHLARLCSGVFPAHPLHPSMSQGVDVCRLHFRDSRHAWPPAGFD